MLHRISGRNFHGSYSITLQGPAEGFVLSDGQTRRYHHKMCPFDSCACGGGYGTGADPDSALMVCPASIDDVPRHLHEAFRAAMGECGVYPTRRYIPHVLLPAK
jgi:hypothetical protein